MSLRVAVLAAALIAAALVLVVKRPATESSTDTQVGHTPWGTQAELAAFLTDAIEADLAGRGLWNPPVEMFLATRRSGRLLDEVWAEAVAGEAAWVEALESVSWSLAEANCLEIAVGFPSDEVSLDEARRLLSNQDRGVRGLELRSDGLRHRLSPTTMVAQNIGIEHAIDRFLDESSAAGSTTRVEEIRFRVFEAEQYLVLRSDGPPRLVPMFRGNELVELDAVRRPNIERLADGLSEWLIHNVGDDGRMTYRYFPSRGTESEANNAIRQFMATRVLADLARRDTGPALTNLAEANLRYNLDRRYREDNGLGVIDDDGDVKLGAVALAALAIMEQPSRVRFAGQERALVAMVDHLWRPDGSFQTFYEPFDRNDQQNFYPGEALLLWAHVLRESPDEMRRQRFMESFRHYRDRHRQDRNPAFVPWHTQAYALVWEETRDPELAAFVFEMNDWLLGLQQWESAPYSDMRGRFYDPERPELGPPHASSTGVYLEGLVDAFTLAAELGDVKRAEAYRRAVLRGLREVAQLQFSDEVDTFYISRPERVVGGLRTTEYDNSIRVDNVQHNLVAALKVLDRFSDSDFEVAE